MILLGLLTGTPLVAIKIKKGTSKEYLITTFEELRMNSFLNTDMKPIVWSRQMAAIIAKITRENRERIKRRKNTWGIRKSRYNLRAFKDHFDPEEDVKVFKLPFRL